MEPILKIISFFFPDLKSSKATHIGFIKDAPAEVLWQGGSFVRPVQEIERGQFRRLAMNLVLTYVGLAFYSLIATFIASEISSKNDTFTKIWSLKKPYMWFIIFMILTLLVFLFQGHILKWKIINKIRTRPNRLFNPNWKCLMICMESVSTFNKFKAIADDFGLLKITPEGLFFEMENHRAFFSVKDISLSEYSKHIVWNFPIKDPSGSQILDPNRIQPLILHCEHPQWSWEVILIAPIQSWNPLGEFEPPKRKKKLLKYISKTTGLNILKPSKDNIQQTNDNDVKH